MDGVVISAYESQNENGAWRWKENGMHYFGVASVVAENVWSSDRQWKMLIADRVMEVCPKTQAAMGVEW